MGFFVFWVCFWFNYEILLEEKDYISGVKVEFLLSRDGFMTKSPKKETEKSEACDNDVKCEAKGVFNTAFHQQP